MHATLITLCALLAFAPTPPPAPANPAIDDLLDRLEESAESLDSFTADVWYEIHKDFLRSREIRRGELIYSTDAETGRKQFAVIFDSLMTGTIGAERMRRQDRKRHYVFDGQWLAEIDACVEPVLDIGEAAAQPLLEEREMIVDVPTPCGGRQQQMGAAIKFSATKPEYRHIGRELGADTEAVLRELGKSDAEIARLAEQGCFS